MKKLLKNANFWLLIASIVVAVVMALVYFLAVMPKPIQGEKTVTLKINYAENSYEYSLSSDKETVLELLKEYDEIYNFGLITQDSQYGEFITSMKGVSQDEEKGYYYSYTLNGGYALGVSTQTIKDGDVLEFRYSYTEYDSDWNVVGETLIGKGDTAIANHIKVAIIIFSIAGVLLIAGVTNFIVSKINKKREEQDA